MINLRKGIQAFLNGELAGMGAFVARLPLLPCAVLFGSLVALRRYAYQKGILKSHRLPLPVVSVGNLVLGGTGKTPFVRLLCRRLLARGVRPLVVSRGYGAKARGDRLDEEGRSLARDLPEAVIVQGRNRVRAVLPRLGQEPRPDVVLLDDGAQALHCARDLEILLVDARRPFGSGWPLPAGTLREFPTALKQARLVVVTRADEVERIDCERLEARLRSAAANGLVVLSRHRPARLIPGGEDPAVLAGRRVFLLSAIASPDSFARTVAGLGADVVGARALPDHHAFTRRDLDVSAQEARILGAEMLVSTGKDEPKLSRLGDPALPLRFVEVEVELTPEGSMVVDRIIDELLVHCHES